MAKSKAEKLVEEKSAEEGGLEEERLEAERLEVEAERLEVEKELAEEKEKEKIPDLIPPDKGGKGEKQEKVKFIKDMPRLYIAGGYYSGTKNETKMLPEFVAQIVRGDGGKRETFAV